MSLDFVLFYIFFVDFLKMVVDNYFFDDHISKIVLLSWIKRLNWVKSIET